MVVYSLKPIRKGDWIFIAKSKGNNIPLAVSANHYSSLDDCLRAAKGLVQEHGAAKFEIEDEEGIALDSRIA